MKPSTLIIVGSVIVVLLIIILAYLILSGGPRSPGGLFADFNIGGEIDTNVVVPTETPEITEPVVNLDRPRLRQLTTRPVIGFVETQATSTEPIFVRYAEAGTGHIYEINLDSGTETRLTNTTIALAHRADFSPDGLTVAIRSENDRRLGELNFAQVPSTPGGLTDIKKISSVGDFNVFSSTTIAYTERTASGVRATAYSTITNTTTPLFTIPFFEATIAWGSSTNATHVVYPKPSHALGGYLYTFSRGNMARLPASGFGLTAINTTNFIVYTEINDFVPKTHVYNKTTGERAELPLVLLPEKCTYDNNNITDTLWCGNEDTTLPLEYPDLWYKGVLSFKDSLWQINLGTASAFHLVDTLTESGRELDVIDIATGQSGTALYFINKNDNTLWMYEL